jgi:hypothetical protein
MPSGEARPAAVRSERIAVVTTGCAFFMAIRGTGKIAEAATACRVFFGRF